MKPFEILALLISIIILGLITHAYFNHELYNLSVYDDSPFHPFYMEILKNQGELFLWLLGISILIIAFRFKKFESNMSELCRKIEKYINKVNKE